MQKKKFLRRTSIALTGVMTFLCVANVSINVSADVKETLELESNVVEESEEQFYILDEDGNPVFIEIKDDIESIEKRKNEQYSVQVSRGDEQEIISEYDNVEEAKEDYNCVLEMSQMATTFAREDSTESNTTEQIVSVIDSDGDVVATSENIIGIVRFARGSATEVLEYQEVDPSRDQGYIHPYYITDAAYIRTESDGIVCKAAGVTMKIPLTGVGQIISYKDQKISYYSVSDNGYLVHTYTYYSGENINYASTRVGYKPDYLTRGTKYYSYDGHYFYATFEDMIADYQTGTHGKAVNANNPYYNYYQYLSLHTKAPFAGSTYNQHVQDYLTENNYTNSKMVDAGDLFVAAQDKYTVNALLMFGLAANESKWGTSNIANTKNNLFGLNAVDKSPGASANTFKSVEQCINEFAYEWVHKDYLNGSDGRYRGPHFGDKNSGMNVKYASDPYWGEKASARGYYIDTNRQDYGKYSIGILPNAKISFYNTTASTKKVIYTSDTSAGKLICDFPVTIIGQETGADGALYYKVVSDMALNADRTARSVDSVYNADRDYVYVKASDVTIVFQCTGDESIYMNAFNSLGLSNSGNCLSGFALGQDVSLAASEVSGLGTGLTATFEKANGTQVTNGVLATGMRMTVSTDDSTRTYSVVIRGDISGDGKLSALDYVKLRNYLDGQTSLSNAYLKSADTNKDGKVSAIDYVKLRNHLDQKSTIVQ